MEFQKKLRTLIKARSGLLWVSTNEEFRGEILIRQMANTLKEKGKPYNLYFWRVSTGLTPIDQGSVDNSSRGWRSVRKDLSNPKKLVQDIHDQFDNGPAVIVCEDFSPYIKIPEIMRYLKDISRKAQGAGNVKNWVQIIVLDTEPCPQANFINVDLPLPERDEIETIVNGMVGAAPETVKDDIELNGNFSAVVDSLQGLEAAQCQQAMAQSLAEVKRIDPKMLIQAKKSLISGSAAITWIDPDPRGLDGVGGLEPLKKYLLTRKKSFRFADRSDPNAPPMPRGILNAGIPGTGKSLVAKTIATAWEVPLLWFNVGRVFGEMVGQSEKGIESALKVAEALSPCILWIDEIEKAFAGTESSGRSDGGTTARVFGSFLKWLNDNDKPIYVVATANEPDLMPPEFFRSGRFDKIFWVDVPNEVDRKAILEVLLEKNNLQDKNIDADEIAAKTANFTGAELEQAILEARQVAYDEDERIATTKDILEAKNDIKPVIIGWGEGQTLSRVRNWARDAAVPANSPETASFEDMTDGSYARTVDMGDTSNDSSGAN